ncbi:hypothetical protein BH23ACT9_BH23ACT9_32090 [soil metagenome]
MELPDETVNAIDALVQQGRFTSRSHAVREGLARVVEDSRRRSIDQAFADGFARIPETAAELADAERLAVQAIAHEPWDPWW